MSEMQSYTFGSDNFMEALALERLRTEENYPITLNDSDFRVFITILRDLALYGEATRSTRVAAVEILGGETLEEWSWWLLSGIGETLNVEGI